MLENRGLQVGQLSGLDVVEDAVQVEWQAGGREVLFVAVLQLLGGGRVIGTAIIL